MAFIKQKTTASVLAAFKKVVTELTEVRDTHIKIADQKESDASQLVSEANEARREATRANEALQYFETIPGMSS